MKNRKWLFHMLKNSIAQRKGRVFIAALSIAIASGVVVGAIGLSLGIRQKLGGELKAYGANIIVSMKNGYLSEDILELLKKNQGIEETSGQLYQRVSVNGMEVEMIGLDFKGATPAASWKVSGRMPEPGEALLGADIKIALKLKEGDTVSLKMTGADAKARVSGFVERGGPEDRAVILDIKDSQRLSGLQGKLSAVLIRGRTDTLDETVTAIGSLVPGAEVKTLRQVAFAEESFLKKIELLMLLVTIVTITASGVSVSSTMSATVLERLKEIAVMKAIGGTKAGIGMFYIIEASFIGLLGGLGGYLLGLLSAEAVSKGAFGSYISMPLYLILLSLVIGLAVAVVASLFPLQPALTRKPSGILRGE